MSDKTRIEWTDATWNPVTGCTKVSDGCKHCYAEREWARIAAPRAKPNRYTGRKFTDVREHGDILDQPLRWRRPRRIFVNSMSDLFHPDVSALFVADVFAVMAACPQHTFQVLTKRAGLMQALLDDPRFRAVAEESLALYTDAPLIWPLPNVWLGVSVEDQATADQRIPLLIDTPTHRRWVSCEPLLGPVDLTAWAELGGFDTTLGISNPGLDWVVAGGESGPKARPMHPDWVRGLRDQCAAADVPFLFKQWGEWLPDERDPEMWHKVGKKAAGRLLDGVLHDGYPRAQP
jgi:protein gp37